MRNLATVMVKFRHLLMQVHHWLKQAVERCQSKIMDLFETLHNMRHRTSAKATIEQREAESERAQELSMFLEFARTRYYKKYKNSLHNELANLDRADVDEPGTASRLQGERRAIRRILDRLEETEAAVNSELRSDRAEFEEQVS